MGKIGEKLTGLQQVAKILKKYEKEQKNKPEKHDWCYYLGELIEKEPNAILQRKLAR